MSMQTNGVSPEWVATGDGAYTIPEDYTCVGFYVTATGSVAFKSYNTDISVDFPSGILVPAHVTSFNAGSTATGIYALLAK